MNLGHLSEQEREGRWRRHGIFTNKTIDDWAWNANVPAQSTTVFPHQQEPTKKMIENWNRTLRQALLKSDSTVEINDDHQHVEPPQPAQTFTEFPLARQRELRVMGQQTLNQDQAAAIIADRLKYGDTVKTFRDGTVKDGISAHGWHI